MSIDSSSDDFLHRAQISDRVFSLSGSIAFGPIRDIMWRSQTLCERLFIAGKIKRGTKILIVGGGIGGLTFAASAIKLKADVVMVEASNRLCSRQCQSHRTICPTIFDFPFAHWSRGIYPISGHRAKLGWASGPATIVARHWMTKFKRLAFRARSRFDVFFKAHFTRFEDWKDTGTAIRAEFVGAQVDPDDGGATPRAEEFNLAVLCLGVGREKVTLDGGDFISRPFWDVYDPVFDFEHTEQNAVFAQEPILLVGGGDGALQDFIGLLCGKRPFREILRAMNFSRQELDALHRIRLTLCANNQLGGKYFDHRFLSGVQQETMQFVDDIWQRSVVRETIATMIRPAEERPLVQIALRCFHFSFSFVANRIIAQLLSRHLAETDGNGGLAPFRAGVEVASIAGCAPHVCSRNPQTCDEHWHTAYFKSCVCPQTSCGATLLGDRLISPQAEDLYSDRARQTVSDATRAHDYRRILLRIGASDFDDLPYRLPAEIVNLALNGDPFRLVTPFYPT